MVYKWFALRPCVGTLLGCLAQPVAIWAKLATSQNDTYYDNLPLGIEKVLHLYNDSCRNKLEYYEHWRESEACRVPDNLN
jgi:hypothetical protein